MAFYYVKNGGTATGDNGRNASLRTGSFATMGASAYYNNIADALSTPSTAFTNADAIIVSSAHIFSAGGSTITYTFPTSTGGKVICVDDLNAENYRPSEGTRGREFNTGTTADINITGFITMWGMELQTVDNLSQLSSTTSTFNDCKVFIKDLFSTSADGAGIAMYGTEIVFDDSGSAFNLSSGGTICADNCLLTVTSGTPVITSGGFGLGGGSIIFRDSDLSSITTTLIANVGNDTIVDDAIYVEIDRCKLASGVAFTNEPFESSNQIMIVKRSSANSSDAEYQYHQHSTGGDFNDDDTIRRAEDPSFTDSGTTISYKIETNSSASMATPFIFSIPLNKFAALSVGASDTLRFYAASTTALDNSQFYIKVSNPNGTNKNETDTIISAETMFNAIVDPLATPVTLTTDSGSDWRDGASPLAGYNEYLIDLATSGGLDCYATITVYVTEPSITIQLGMGFDLV